LPALKMLRIFLFGLSNRRRTAGSQQPERYVQWRLKFVHKLCKKILTKLEEKLIINKH
jgi:hypothetical protein